LIRANIIYEKGSFDLKPKGGGSKKVGTRGYLIDINCDYGFTKTIFGSVFFYVSSGDRRPESGKFRSFISIDPYIDKTNIFFNGGLDSEFSSDNLGLNGIQLTGVMTPGIFLQFQPIRNLTLKYVLAYLFTQKGTGGRGHSYGWETDLMADYSINDHCQLFMEFNLFKPGSFYRRLTSKQEHTSTEMIMGINYIF
jgi:hypothetical protein